MLKNKKGFTLIELLVVVAIIGILAGILVLSLSGVSAGNKLSARKAKLEAVVLLSDGVCDNLSNGQDDPGNGSGDIQYNTIVSTTVFYNQIYSRVSDEYEVVVTITSDDATALLSKSNSYDVVVLSISGLGVSLATMDDTGCYVKGAWFIPKGENSIACTYNYVTRTFTEGATDLS